MTRPLSRREVLALPLALGLGAAGRPARAQAQAQSQAQSQAWIDAFGGWASPHGGVLYARVHRGPPADAPRPHQSSYVRLIQSLKALDTAALPGAAVAIAGVPGLSAGHADDNGFLKLPLPAGLAPGALPVTLRLHTPGFDAAPVHLEVLVHDDHPGLGVISDIDDTLTDTGVTHKLRMLSHTLLRSTWEVRTFPGAPQAVTALCGAGAGAAPGGVPVFYVSGSPWGLCRRIGDFFQRSGFPRGSMILRRYSQEPLDGYAFKLPHLRELVAAFPQRRWILLGDSGEKDPEVYATLRRERAEAVAATYIHLVTDEPADSPRFAGAVVFRDYRELARRTR